mmetsp:Transcript_73140/g.169618  ORF Transcript_73140/g.169618 Transcript_73140/m.169618 type:complete len:301 (+) Transcript_73140:456-1358(+)
MLRKHQHGATVLAADVKNLATAPVHDHVPLGVHCPFLRQTAIGRVGCHVHVPRHCPRCLQLRMSIGRANQVPESARAAIHKADKVQRETSPVPCDAPGATVGIAQLALPMTRLADRAQVNDAEGGSVGISTVVAEDVAIVQVVVCVAFKVHAAQEACHREKLPCGSRGRSRAGLPVADVPQHTIAAVEGLCARPKLLPQALHDEQRGHVPKAPHHMAQGDEPGLALPASQVVELPHVCFTHKVHDVVVEARHDEHSSATNRLQEPPVGVIEGARELAEAERRTPLSRKHGDASGRAELRH